MCKRLISSVSVAIAAALIGVGAMAAEPKKPAAAGEAVQPVLYHGVQVYIDANGRIRQPTAAERAALSHAMQQQYKPRAGAKRPLTDADAAATIKRFSRGQVGRVSMVPQSKIHYLTAERKADGSLAIGHADGQTPAAAQEVTP